MKQLFAIVLTVLALVCTETLRADDPARAKKLQQAIDLLESKGDVARAIPLLEDVAKSADYALAARGLLYLGQAQERQGKDGARRTYERIIKEFSAQTAIVTEARTRLTALGGAVAAAGAVTSRLVWTMPLRAWASGNVSPDGRYLPYIDENDDLFLHDFTTGTDRLLVRHQDEAYAEETAFSRDGRRLAYAWCDDKTETYELRVVDVTGSAGAPASRAFIDTTVDYLLPYDWTPDGKSVVVMLEPKSGGAEIALISVSGGPRRTLKAAPRWSLSLMSVSPDGKYVAFDWRNQETGAQDIHLLSLDGGAEIQAVAHRAHDELLGWSADGTRLLFFSDRTGSRDLWAQRFDGGKPEGGAELIKRDVGNGVFNGTTADGRLYSTIAGSASETDIKTGALDFATGEWSSPPADAVREYVGGSIRSPVWSPDGQHLAYVADRRRRGGLSIAIRALDSEETRELRPKLSTLWNLHWTPDSAAFLVRGSAFDGRCCWWRIDASTRALTFIDVKYQGTNYFAQWIEGWSRDGSKVYLSLLLPGAKERVLVERDLSSNIERELFRGRKGTGVTDQSDPEPRISRDGRKVYYRRALAGDSKPPFREVAFIERDVVSGQERELARGQLGGVNVSPDGQFIATGSNDAASKSRRLLLIPLDGGKPTELMRVPLPESVLNGLSAPSNPLGIQQWAPDSRSILFGTWAGPRKPTELWWVAVDGQQPARRLAQGADVSIHPDGRRIAFQVTRSEPPKPSQVWVLENLLQAPSPKK